VVGDPVSSGKARGAIASMRLLGRSAASYLGVVVCATGLACGGRSLSPPPVDPKPMDRPTYVIGVTDVLQIVVWKNEDLSARVPVRPDGKISVPLLDDVQAEGLTPVELKEVLTRELGEYVTAPDVAVIVIEMNSQFVSIVGDVARNAQIPLTKDLRVLEAIAAVGGFNTFSDKGDIRIVRRRADGSEAEFAFDYDAYIAGKAPGTNIVLQNGDTIIVHD
jgi:polysaccharide biosynthesis/export protein